MNAFFFLRFKALGLRGLGFGHVLGPFGGLRFRAVWLPLLGEGLRLTAPIILYPGAFSQGFRGLGFRASKN